VFGVEPSTVGVVLERIRITCSSYLLMLVIRVELVPLVWAFEFVPPNTLPA
jgi:hypothetical protein